MAVAGSYDFIAEQAELYSWDYVNSMIDSGYEPCYVPSIGWRWLRNSTNSPSSISSTSTLNRSK